MSFLMLTLCPYVQLYFVKLLRWKVFRLLRGNEKENDYIHINKNLELPFSLFYIDQLVKFCFNYFYFFFDELVSIVDVPWLFVINEMNKYRHRDNPIKCILKPKEVLFLCIMQFAWLHDLSTRNIIMEYKVKDSLASTEIIRTFIRLYYII